MEKQTKVFEDQREKQIKALEEHGKELLKSRYENDSLTILKRQGISYELVNERKNEIHRLSKQINFNNLICYYQGKSAPKYFIYFKGPLILYNNIQNGYIDIQKAEKIQEEIKSDLREITKGNSSINQKSK